MKKVSILLCLVSRTGAFATLKEKSLAYRRSHFSEPDGFKSIRTGNIQQKSTGQFLCFLLVTRTGLEPMLPP